MTRCLKRLTYRSRIRRAVDRTKAEISVLRRCKQCEERAVRIMHLLYRLDKLRRWEVGE